MAYSVNQTPDLHYQPRIQMLPSSQMQHSYMQTDTDDEGVFFETIKQRLQTFTKYPGPGSPYELARAGFSYTFHGNAVHCTSCGVWIVTWKPDSIPLTEHARHSPMCPFLKAAKPKERRQRKSLEFSEDGAVKAILDLGVYSLDDIRAAAVRLEIGKEMTAENLMDILWAMKSQVQMNSDSTVQNSNLNDEGYEAQDGLKIKREVDKGKVMEEKVQLEAVRCNVCKGFKEPVLLLPCQHEFQSCPCDRDARYCPCCKKDVVEGRLAFSLS